MKRSTVDKLIGWVGIIGGALLLVASGSFLREPGLVLPVWLCVLGVTGLLTGVHTLRSYDRLRTTLRWRDTRDWLRHHCNQRGVDPRGHAYPIVDAAFHAGRETLP